MAKSLADLFVNVGADISEFKKQMNDMKKTLKDVGGKMKDIGASMTQSVTLPLVGLGTGAIMAANDMQKSAGQIQASLGLTKEEAEGLNKAATELWRDGFGENVEDAARNVASVTQNMQGLGQTDKEIKKLTEQAFTLRDAFGAEVNESTRAAAVMMRNFGIDGTKAMDLITVGFQKGGDYSGELLDTMREYAPQFATMGHSAEDMLGILISGAEAGAWNLDKVGDAVKEFNIRAKDGSDATADGFEAIGLNATEMGTAIAEGGEKGQAAFQATIAALAAMDDPVKRNTAGVALFGTQWEDLESNVVQAMANGVGKITEFEGATQQATDAMYDNVGTQMTQVWRDFVTALQPVGEVLVQIAQDILPKVSAALSDLANWFKNLSPTMQKTVLIILAIIAAIGPLLVVAGTLMSALSALAPLFTAVKIAIAVMSGPIGLIIAAIAALIGIGVLLYKNWDTVKKWAGIAWDKIKSIVGAGVDWVKDKFNSILSFVIGLGRSFYNAGKGLINQIKNGITNAASSVINKVKSVAGKIRDMLPFSPAKEGPLSDLDKLDFGGPIGDSIQKAIPNVQNMMNDLVTMPDITAGESTFSTTEAERGQTIISFERMLEGANINVKDENDVTEVARELHRMTTNALRVKGVML